MNAPRVGVGVVITRGDEVLLLHRKNVHGEGTWSTPGGHLEFGETPEACAAREVLEETGVQVGNICFVSITNDVFDESRHYITIWMRGEYQGGEAHVAAENMYPSPLIPPSHREGGNIGEIGDLWVLCTWLTSVGVYVEL
jgi:ADP-ribose pyrophosphatase YjhB (NUDIX family)